MVTPTAAMITTATPIHTVTGRFSAPDPGELEPTVTWTVVEWDRDPLVAVTLTE
jgi:hypothetical protein